MSVTAAEALLLTDMQRAIAAAREDVATYEHQPEEVQFVLEALAYQLGRSGLARFRRFIAHVNAGEYALAAVELHHSRLAEQCPERTEIMAQVVAACQR